MAIGRDMICLNKSYTFKKVGGGGFFPAVYFSIPILKVQAMEYRITSNCPKNYLEHTPRKKN